MSNKRNLKKLINYICSDLFSECVAASLFSSKQDKTDANAILTSILMMHRDYICRISHPEPGLPAKKYYQDLIDNFNRETGDIIDQIENLL